MNATRRTHSTRTTVARLLVGAALAVIFSVALDAEPAYADPGQRHSGRWYGQNDRTTNWGYRDDDDRDNDGRDNGRREYGRRDGGRDDNDWRNDGRGHNGRSAGRHLGWRNHQYAHRHNSYPAHRWHANSYSGRGQSGYYGHQGGASITLNFPIR